MEMRDYREVLNDIALSFSKLSRKTKERIKKRQEEYREKVYDLKEE